LQETKIGLNDYVVDPCILVNFSWQQPIILRIVRSAKIEKVLL